MNGLPGSPLLTDVAGSWLASMVLLFAVVSKGIAGVNVLSRCTTNVGGAVTRAISSSDSVFVSGIVPIDGLDQIDVLGKGKSVVPPSNGAAPPNTLGKNEMRSNPKMK